MSTKLEKLESISKIVISLVSAVSIAYFGYTTKIYEVDLNHANLELSKRNQQLKDQTQCVQLHKDVVNNAVVLSKIKKDTTIDTLAKECGVDESHAAKFVNKITNLKEVAVQKTETKATTTDTVETSSRITRKGFVVLGKLTPEKYSHNNFDNLTTSQPGIQHGKPPFKGDILKSRWTVNMRINTELTTSGKNKVVATLPEAACAKIINQPQIHRGQYWAEVEQVKCN